MMPFARRSTWLALILLPLGPAATVLSAESAAYDLLFRGARVIDGGGGPAVDADVAVRDGRIAAIGRLDGAEAGTVIDAEGMILCPGFVDLHSHADRSILKLRDAENYVRQGVTTLVVGNCGSSPVNSIGFFHALHDGGAGVNTVLLIGHGSVRQAVVGDRNVPPTPSQLEQMRARVRQAMEAGAVGLSTGLRYRPGAYADTDEVVAVTREIAPLGGFYATHMRDEGPTILEALDEALLIGREAGVPVHVSHHKISTASVWGLTRLTLARIEQVRSEGRDVTLDHYPYGAGSSGISLMVPQGLIAGGSAAFRRRMADPEARQRTLAAVEQLVRRKLFESGQDPEREAHLRTALARIQIARLASEPELEGKNLTEILDSRSQPITLRSGAELIVELVGKGAGAIYHTIDDRPGGDVDRVMQHPQAAIASDGVIPALNEGHPHPRSYGTFPRVLARYVRERKLLSWEQAIHKMSGLPAKRLGWTDRGLIKPGYRADLVLLDPERIRDEATFAAPHQYAQGVVHVLIGGDFVLRSEKMTGRRPGRPVYSMPVADTSAQRLRRDAIDLLGRFDGRFALRAVDDEGRELVSFNADDPIFLAPPPDAPRGASVLTPLREVSLDRPAGGCLFASRSRPAPAAADDADAAGNANDADRVHLSLGLNCDLPSGGRLHVAVAYRSLPASEQRAATAAVREQLVARLRREASRAEEAENETPPPGETPSE